MGGIMDNKIGESYKKYRTSKHITLAQAAEGVATASFVSKFEHGTSRVSVDILIKLLDNIHVSFVEFTRINEIISDKYFYDENNRLADLLEARNVTALFMVNKGFVSEFQSSGDVEQRILAVISEAALTEVTRNQLSPKSVEFITGYLFGIDEWTQYELTIFAKVVAKLPTNVQVVMGEQLVRKLNKRVISNQNSLLLGTTLLNMIDSQLEERNVTVAARSLKIFEQFYKHTDNYLLKVRYQYFLGLYTIIVGNVEHGRNVSATAISVMQFVGDDELAILHDKYLAETLLSVKK